MLIAHGADINAENNGGRTPLHDACQYSSEMALTRFLEIAVIKDINKGDRNGDTPLHVLTHRIGPDIRFDYGFGFHNIIQKMIGLGACVNARNKGGETPLMGSCEKGDMDAVRVLLDAGADINATSSKGATCLQMFCGSDYRGLRLPIVRYLVDRHGADVNIKNIFGHRAIDYVRGSDRREVRSFLETKSGQ